MSIRIAHIADVHLRSQQYGYKSRGLDFFEGFRSAVDACIDAEADAILCSGDLFDTTAPASDLVVNQLGRIRDILAAAKIPMIISAGNHDGNKPHWASVYKDSLSILVPPADKVIQLYGATPKETVGVVALPWMNPYELREALKETPSADILMWHGEIKEFTGYPKPDAIEMNDFPRDKWQLIAMGDQHVHKMLRREDGLVVAYPGSTESCSKAEDHGKKAYMYTFTFEDGKAKLSNIEDVPFETRPKQELVLHTEEDVDKACDTIISGALVYCDYAMGLKNVRNRLVAAAVTRGLVPPTISMTPFTTLKATRDIRMEREASIVTPGQYVHDNAKQYFGEEYRERLTPFCENLLTPTLDPKDTIARFCKEALE